MSQEEVEPVETSNIRYKPSVLDLFKNITSINEQQQTKSQLTLLKHLKLNGTQEDVAYTLKRFVKGLGAQNHKSKIGFYCALVALIKTSNITAADVIAAVNKELQASSKNTKSENADISSGQILAIGAIIRSGLIRSESNDTKKQLVDILISAGHKRDYLVSSAYLFTIELLDKFTQKEFKSIVIPIIQKHHNEVKCLDSLFVMVAVNKYMPGVNIFNNISLEAQNINEICRILMNPPKLAFQNHPIYKLFADWLITNPHNIPHFTIELDTYLHKDKATFNNFSLALTILTHVTEAITDTSLIPHTLQNNLLHQILAHCNQTRGSPKDPLKRLINAFLDKIAQSLANASCKTKHKIATLKKLWFHPGSLDFERIVASRVIQQIIAGLSVDGVRKLADLLVVIVKGGVESERGFISNHQRVYAAQLLVKVISHPKAVDVPWKAGRLIVLADVSLFVHPDVSNELSASLREVFFRGLDIKLPKLVELRNVLSQLVHHINKRLYEDMSQPSIIIDAANGQLWKETLIRIDEFEQNKSQPLIEVFHTLFLNIVLQIYRDESTAQSSLRELFSCYERACAEKSTEQDVQWIQVVVDLFLSLLSQNTHLLRSLVRCVFPHLCPHLNRDAIHQILAVFEPNNDIATLLGHEDSGDDESKDNDSDENEDSGDNSSAEDDPTQDNAVNDRLRDALSTALRNRGVSQSDEESVDVENIDDEEASKIDEALASAFKQFRPNTGKKSKKQSKEEQTLTHFRVRVLDLIDVYLETAPPMHSALEIMLPLMQCLEYCIRDVHQLPLLRRIGHCLKKLRALKRFSCVEGVTQQILHDLLLSLLEKGSKSALMMQDMSNELTECCVFVLKCSNVLVAIGEGKSQTKNALIQELIVKELQKFLLQRDCLTPQQFFKNILSMTWKGNIRLANELVERAFDDQVRPFKRSQALDILRLFYLNSRFLSGCTDKDKLKLKQLEKNVLSKTKEILSNDKATALKDKFVTNLFRLLQAIKKSTLEAEIDVWQSLGETIREYRCGVTLSKDSRLNYNKLCNCLGVNQTVEMKQSPVVLQTEQKVVGANGIDKCKVKAKGSNKEQRKERKAARLLRMQSLSEGFDELVPFASPMQEDTEDKSEGKLGKSKKRTQSGFGDDVDCSSRKNRK